MNDRVIGPLLQAAAGAFGMLPVRARCVAPPLQRIVERDGHRGGDEDGGARHEFVSRNARIVSRIERTFSDRHVSRGFDEPLERGVRHRRAVHPETVDRDEMHGERVRHAAVLTPHPECAARNPRHAGGRRARCDGGIHVRGSRRRDVGGRLCGRRMRSRVRVRFRSARDAGRDDEREHNRKDPLHVFSGSWYGARYVRPRSLSASSSPTNRSVVPSNFTDRPTR